jgi:hypothetical protein
MQFGVVSGSDLESRGEGDGVFFRRCGLCIVIALRGVTGAGIDGIRAAQAIEEAAGLKRPIVLQIRSAGGCVDDALLGIAPAIHAARAAKIMVGAFLGAEVHGSAFFLASECDTIVASRRARIGHFAVRASRPGWSVPAHIAGCQAETWARVRANRPSMTTETLERHADSDMPAEVAEFVGAVDAIGTLAGFVRGTLERCT